MVRASAVAERAGVPSASLVCDGFTTQATTTAAGLGFANLPLARLVGHVDVQSAEELAENVRDVTVDAIVSNLTRALAASEDTREPEPTEIVFSGSFDEVNQYFLGREWSEGLPVVPPTPERVRAFLEFTDHDPHHVLGLLLPERREATVWNVAVNGVIAGCRPEYMPVLLAIAEALADPGFGIEHS